MNRIPALTKVKKITWHALLLVAGLSIESPLRNCAFAGNLKVVRGDPFGVLFPKNGNIQSLDKKQKGEEARLMSIMKATRKGTANPRCVGPTQNTVLVPQAQSLPSSVQSQEPRVEAPQSLQAGPQFKTQQPPPPGPAREVME
jgi:hypothetical protein